MYLWLCAPFIWNPITLEDVFNRTNTTLSTHARKIKVVQSQRTIQQ